MSVSKRNKALADIMKQANKQNKPKKKKSKWLKRKKK